MLNALKNPWILILLLLVVMVGGAIIFSQSVSVKYNDGVVIKSHIKGNPEAAVKLVEYSDFQCPACAQFQPYINELMSTYGDQLSFEYRHFPLIQIHRLAEGAAQAAEAAGQQGKFFEFHDLLFTNQTTWSASANPSQFYLEYAKQLGLDTELFVKHQRASLLRDHIRSQFSEARDLGFTGTPSFTLNGEVMRITSFDDFRSQIENAINPNFDVAPTISPVPGVVDSSTDSEAPTEAAPAVRFGL